MTEGLTCDDFLGGRVRLWQPIDGYRAGVDPVLLAAATPARAGETVLELGCGAGAASLCLAERVPNLAITGLELQPEYADLARRNAQENSAQFTVVTGDILDPPPEIKAAQFEHVIMNPPYYLREHSTPAENAGRDIALGGETPLSEWITLAAKRLKPKGFLTLIQKIDRMPEALTHVQALFGSIVVQPIAPRANKPTNLFILCARKDGRAPFAMRVPFVLHEGDRHMNDGESYNQQTREILREAAQLAIIRH